MKVKLKKLKSFWWFPFDWHMITLLCRSFLTLIFQPHQTHPYKSCDHTPPFGKHTPLKVSNNKSNPYPFKPFFYN